MGQYLLRQLKMFGWDVTISPTLGPEKSTEVRVALLGATSEQVTQFDVGLFTLLRSVGACGKRMAIEHPRRPKRANIQCRHRDVCAVKRDFGPVCVDA